MTHRETDYGSEPDSNWGPECECDDECVCEEHDGWDSVTEAVYDAARGK